MENEREVERERQRRKGKGTGKGKGKRKRQRTRKRERVLAQEGVRFCEGLSCSPFRVVGRTMRFLAPLSVRFVFSACSNHTRNRWFGRHQRRCKEALSTPNSNIQYSLRVCRGCTSQIRHQRVNLFPDFCLLLFARAFLRPLENRYRPLNIYLQTPTAKAWAGRRLGTGAFCRQGGHTKLEAGQQWPAAQSSGCMGSSR